MKLLSILLFLLLSVLQLRAQLYFPPNNSSEWETIAPETMGWCNNKIDSLYDYLNSNNSVAFLLLKDGKIVLEKYFGEHTPTSYWYWASAGKTLTSFMVGIAQQEGYLDINDKTSDYLGTGWTSCTQQQEAQITIRNQITMTSGLDDAGVDPYCTIDTCLVYLADAGTRWAYHNAPYTLLDGVIENATGTMLNNYTATKVKSPTGMDGFYFQSDFNNVFYSTARSMARFGLLILNKGNWNGNAIMTDTNYYHEMVNTSQEINKSYGYLWWLNGKESFMMPQSQFVFPGKLCPNAPDDMFAAIGKNGQFINVVPSQNLVWIRMGNAPDGMLVPSFMNDSIWKYINNLNCNPNGYAENISDDHIKVYPNPAKDLLYFRNPETGSLLEYSLFDITGRLILSGQTREKIDVGQVQPGIYHLIINKGEQKSVKIVVID